MYRLLNRSITGHVFYDQLADIRSTRYFKDKLLKTILFQESTTTSTSCWWACWHRFSSEASPRNLWTKILTTRRVLPRASRCWTCLWRESGDMTTSPSPVATYTCYDQKIKGRKSWWKSIQSLTFKTEIHMIVKLLAATTDKKVPNSWVKRLFISHSLSLCLCPPIFEDEEVFFYRRSRVCVKTTFDFFTRVFSLSAPPPSASFSKQVLIKNKNKNKNKNKTPKK